MRDGRDERPGEGRGDDGHPMLDDDEFTRTPLAGGAPGRPAWWRGDGSRRDLVFLLAAWVTLLPFTLALTARIANAGPGVTVTPGGVAPTVTLTGRPPLMLASGGWQRIALPAPDGAPGAVANVFAPSPTDPATIFACGGPPSDPARGAGPHAIGFWRTRDAGAHWTSLALPSLSGTWCAVGAAADAPRRIAATARAGGGATGRACSDYALFLSDDGGDTWERVAHASIGPANATYAGCAFWATAHHLFFSYGYELGEGPGARQLSILERSDDGGRTWERADVGLGGDALFSAWQLGGDDTFVASVIRAGAQGSRGSELWETRDAGRTWRPILTMADHWTTNLMTAPRPGATVFGARAPIYALVQEQIPSILFRLQARQLGADGTRWDDLPPLPVAGASPDRMGLTQIVGETADGRLLALGVDPARGVPPESAGNDALHAATAAQWVWIWDPRSSRWQVMDAPLPVPLGGCGLCFAHAVSRGAGPEGAAEGTYLWLRSWDSPEAAVYRLFLPDAPAASRG